MSDTFNNIIEESKTLLKSLYQKNEVTSYKDTTVEAFRGDLLNFINGQLNQISRSQTLLDLVDAEIVKNLCLHMYDKNELLTLRKELLSGSSSKTAILLEPFKPSSGNSNPLINPPIPTGDSNDDIPKSLSSEQRQSLYKVEKLLEMISKRGLKEEE
jgi:hypothetical protein